MHVLALRTKAGAPMNPAVNLILDWWPAEMKPNGSRSGAHAYYNKLAQEYREAIRKVAHSEALEQALRGGFTLPLPEPVHCRITFAVPTRQERDLDNCIAAWKHGQDGLVDAGILRSDSCWSLVSLTAVPLHVPTLKRPEVRVRLRGAALL